MARQGDVLITRVAALPAGAKQRKTSRVVLAEGEVTGHAHVVTGPAELYDADRQTYLRVGVAAAVQHEEHSTIELPPGDYRVTIQSEYEPQAIRNVAD